MYLLVINPIIPKTIIALLKNSKAMLIVNGFLKKNNSKRYNTPAIRGVYSSSQVRIFSSFVIILALTLKIKSSINAIINFSKCFWY